VGEALAESAPIEEAFAESGAPAELVAGLLEAGIPVLPVPDGVLDRAGEARTSQGLAAVVRAPRLDAPATVPSDALVLALCGVADPGNVGTLVRTADAAGAAAVLLSGPCADPLSPKVVRAAAGALFRVRVAEVDDPLAVLDAWGLTALGALRVGGCTPDDLDLTGGVGLVLGSEVHGLPPTVEDRLAARGALVSIPMPGRAESLNVAMAGTVLTFEVLRRRSHGSAPDPG
jgi:TrmH family RNA methyltransferase